MNIKVISCSECGAPLRVSEGQFLSLCKFCNVKYYVKQDFPPAITIKDNVGLKDAKMIVLDQLRNKFVSKGFLSNSFFEKGTLFFIPMIEIRGIKIKSTSEKINGKNEFGYTAYDYIENGSNLSDIEIDFIEGSILENGLLDADQTEYNISDMRKKGVVLPLKSDFMLRENSIQDEQNIVEKHIRIIYFPIWEINYSYSGIVFKSYISAIDGTPIKIQAIKDHRRKVLFSILGIFSIGIFIARGLKFFLLFLVGSKLGMQNSSIMVGFSMFGALAAIIVGSLLMPFFWEMFAFREIVLIRKDGIESHLINYSENSFTKFLKGVLKKVEFFFTVNKIDDGRKY